MHKFYYIELDSLHDIWIIAGSQQNSILMNRLITEIKVLRNYSIDVVYKCRHEWISYILIIRYYIHISKILCKSDLILAANFIGTIYVIILNFGLPF